MWAGDDGSLDIGHSYGIIDCSIHKCGGILDWRCVKDIPMIPG